MAGSTGLDVGPGLWSTIEPGEGPPGPADAPAGPERRVEVAVDAPGVRRVLAAGEKARQKKLSFVSGFQTRYSPAAREEVKRVHDGEIGDIVSIEGVYNTGPLWHRGRQPAVAALAHAPDTLAGRGRGAARGGGPLACRQRRAAVARPGARAHRGCRRPRPVVP